MITGGLAGAGEVLIRWVCQSQIDGSSVRSD